MVGFDNDIVSLAHGNEQRLGLVRHYWDEIHGYDFELVLVDCEPENDFGAGVYESKEVFFSFGEMEVVSFANLGFVLVLAVDEAVDGDGRDAEGGYEGPAGELKDGFVVVVCEEDGAEIDIPAGSGGACIN